MPTLPRCAAARTDRHHAEGAPGPPQPCYLLHLHYVDAAWLTMAQRSPRGSAKHGAHRRRPPLRATVRRRYPVGVEPARDLTQAPAAGVLGADPGDDAGRDRGP